MREKLYNKRKILYYIEWYKDGEFNETLFIDNTKELLEFLKDVMEKIMRGKIDYFEIKKCK